MHLGDHWIYKNSPRTFRGPLEIIDKIQHSTKVNKIEMVRNRIEFVPFDFQLVSCEHLPSQDCRSSNMRNNKWEEKDFKEAKKGTVSS